MWWIDYFSDIFKNLEENVLKGTLYYILKDKYKKRQAWFKIGFMKFFTWHLTVVTVC